jgi:hypothetical protein
MVHGLAFGYALGGPDSETMSPTPAGRPVVHGGRPAAPLLGDFFDDVRVLTSRMDGWRKIAPALREYKRMEA